MGYPYTPCHYTTNHFDRKRKMTWLMMPTRCPFPWELLKIPTVTMAFNDNWRYLSSILRNSLEEPVLKLPSRVICEIQPSPTIHCRPLTVNSQMIAIGGVIGTGLFLGTGSDLENGGPAGLLLGYCIMASLLYSVMVRLLVPTVFALANSSQIALGEMSSQFPIPGGQFALAGRFNSPELGFAMGVLFWFK